MMTLTDLALAMVKQWKGGKKPLSILVERDGKLYAEVIIRKLPVALSRGDGKMTPAKKGKTQGV